MRDSKDAEGENNRHTDLSQVLKESSYPAPKKRGPARKARLVVYVIVIIVVVCSVALFLNWLVWYYSPRIEPPSQWNLEFQVTSNTIATVTFAKMGYSLEPTGLKVQLRLSDFTAWANYTWPTNNDGETLSRNQTDPDLATIVYHDLDDNGRADVGDYLELIGLSPDSSYFLMMFCTPIERCVIDAGSFSTPYS